MPIPTYEALMLPVLKYAAGRTWKMSDLVAQIADDLQLTPAELSTTIPSGKTLLISSRVHWAKTYLKQAGLLSQPKRAFVDATQRGRDLLQGNPSQITLAMLHAYPEFQAFISGSATAINGKGMKSGATAIPTATPEEQIEQAEAVLNAALRDALLQRVLEASPAFFEQLILDLLLAMGYGGSRTEAAEHVGQSGDGGIDGVINEDRLGLDRIYVQAKRYSPTSAVGGPAVQSFIGALVNRGAQKGVMITTSSFTSSAVSAAKAAGQLRLVLIDGEELASLLIKVDVGVRVARTVDLKRIDLDYFDQTADD